MESAATRRPRFECRIGNACGYVHSAEPPLIGGWTIQAEIEGQGRTISDRSHNVTDMGIPVTVGIGKELGPSTCGTVNHRPACHDFMLQLGVGEAWQRWVIDRMSAQVDARTKRVADPLPV